jgi:hypothetical protein
MQNVQGVVVSGRSELGLPAVTALNEKSVDDGDGDGDGDEEGEEGEEDEEYFDAKQKPGEGSVTDTAASQEKTGEVLAATPAAPVPAVAAPVPAAAAPPPPLQQRHRHANWGSCCSPLPG